MVVSSPVKRYGKRWEIKAVMNQVDTPLYYLFRFELDIYSVIEKTPSCRMRLCGEKNLLSETNLGAKPPMR